MCTICEQDPLLLASNIRVVESKRDEKGGLLFVMIEFEDSRLNWEKTIGLIGPVNMKRPPYSTSSHYSYWRVDSAANAGCAQDLIDRWREAEPDQFRSFQYDAAVGQYAEIAWENTPRAHSVTDFKKLLKKNKSLTRPGLVGRVVDTLPGLNETRFWGPLVWPKGQDVPKDQEGRDLVQILLVDLATLPEIDGLPQKGLLQFLIADNDELGMSFEEDELGDYSVVLHPPGTELVEIKRVDDGLGALLEDGDKPSLGIEWVRADCPPDLADYRLETMAEKNGYPSDEQRERYEEILSEAYGDDFDVVLLGTPAFTQTDVRSKKEMSNWVNLVRITSTKAMMWGDGGEGDFLISPKALKAGDVSKVYFPPIGDKPPASSRFASAKLLVIFLIRAHAILPQVPRRVGNKVSLQGAARSDARAYP